MSDNQSKDPRPDTREIHPGDEVPAGTAQTGENLCRVCGGSGRAQDGFCSACGGTGYVVVTVGDA